MMLTSYACAPSNHSFDLQIDQLFDNAFRRGEEETSPRFPLWNVYEKGDWFWVDAAVPGLTAKDIDLTVRDGILTLAVSPVRPGGEADPGIYFVREIGCEGVTRSMRLPDYIDLDKATASCKDGVLSVGFPKRAAVLARQIPVLDEQAD